MITSVLQFGHVNSIRFLILPFMMFVVFKSNMCSDNRCLVYSQKLIKLKQGRFQNSGLKFNPFGLWSFNVTYTTLKS